jgi:cytochrome c biogenesis protein CcdA
MTILAYSLYLAIAIGMTVWVATNGKIYLIRCFGHDEELATSVNHLLVVGFYLVNFGFIALALSAAGTVKTTAELMRFLGWYVGIAILVLGLMHFFNMGAVTRHGKKVADWMHERAPKPMAAAVELTAPVTAPAAAPAKTTGGRLLD